MPLDISKSHTKIEINLSKPYHQGPLLVDLKSKNSKKLIDIKPIRKAVAAMPIQNQEKLDIEDNKDNKDKYIDQITEKVFSSKVKSSTLDFDMLNEFDDLLNPFTKVDYRNAKDIQINFEPNVAPQKIEKIKQLGDVKKITDQASNISFSSLKPKINVGPLHSRSRILAVVDHKRVLTKKLKKNQIKPDDYKVDLKNFETYEETVSLEDINKQDFFQFKVPPKFDSRSIPHFVDQSYIKEIGDKINKPDSNHLQDKSRVINPKKNRSYKKLKRYCASTLFTTVIIIFCTLFLTGNAQWMGKFGEKNVQADKNKNIKIINYDQWITDKNFGNYSAPGEDLDKDNLNNYEEFLINSIPTNKNSCNVNVTDNQNLLNLIDPITCLPIDFNAPGQIERFRDVLNITPEFIQKNKGTVLQNQVFETPPLQTVSSIVSVSTSNKALITDIVPVPNIEITLPATPTFIEVKAEISAPKITTQASLIEQPKSSITSKNDFNIDIVQAYIDQYRSYDKFDNQMQNPVNAEYFVGMSKRYDVPLKYVLALARSESRFGTDQFNQDGSSNRIGRHLNMYSIGLDDEGGSITYPSWEAGVDAFGRWYQKFDKQGYSDCAKWRIYNPNGDYCQKIENLSSQIEDYIGN